MANLNSDINLYLKDSPLNKIAVSHILEKLKLLDHMWSKKIIGLNCKIPIIQFIYTGPYYSYPREYKIHFFRPEYYITISFNNNYISYVVHTYKNDMIYIYSNNSCYIYDFYKLNNIARKYGLYIKPCKYGDIPNDVYLKHKKLHKLNDFIFDFSDSEIDSETIELLNSTCVISRDGRFKYLSQCEYISSLQI